MTAQHHTPQQLIAEDLKVTRQMRQLLEDEQQALAERDHQEVLRLLESKQNLLNCINANNASREHLLAAHGFNNHPEAWIDYLKSTGDDGLLQQWEVVEENLSACSECNQINGHMIERSKRISSQLLDLLRGGISNLTLYSDKGDKKASRASNTVAKA